MLEDQDTFFVAKALRDTEFSASITTIFDACLSFSDDSGSMNLCSYSHQVINRTALTGVEVFARLAYRECSLKFLEMCTIPPVGAGTYLGSEYMNIGPDSLRVDV